VIVEGIDGLRAAVGTHFGFSDWIEVDQARVDRFADSTGDHQWIHVDVERARRESPFGGPIAHGYLTMSLSNALLPTVVEVRGISMGVNYGVDKVRFPAPVPVGSRVRAGVELVEVTDVGEGVQTKMVITMEIDGADRPACVIEALSRFYP
jgi:acyl dehydratase